MQGISHASWATSTQLWPRWFPSSVAGSIWDLKHDLGRSGLRSRSEWSHLSLLELFLQFRPNNWGTEQTTERDHSEFLSEQQEMAKLS